MDSARSLEFICHLLTRSCFKMGFHSCAENAPTGSYGWKHLAISRNWANDRKCHLDSWLHFISVFFPNKNHLTFKNQFDINKKRHNSIAIINRIVKCIRKFLHNRNALAFSMLHAMLRLFSWVLNTVFDKITRLNWIELRFLASSILFISELADPVTQFKIQIEIGLVPAQYIWQFVFILFMYASIKLEFVRSYFAI